MSWNPSHFPATCGRDALRILRVTQPWCPRASHSPRSVARELVRQRQEVARLGTCAAAPGSKPYAGAPHSAPATPRLGRQGAWESGGSMLRGTTPRVPEDHFSQLAAQLEASEARAAALAAALAQRSGSSASGFGSGVGFSAACPTPGAPGGSPAATPRRRASTENPKGSPARGACPSPGSRAAAAGVAVEAALAAAEARAGELTLAAEEAEGRAEALASEVAVQQAAAEEMRQA